jgi:hypothetical protein
MALRYTHYGTSATITMFHVGLQFVKRVHGQDMRSKT